MRWLVKVSPVAGMGGSDTVTVEAPNWRAALARARATRGEPESIGGFHVEVSDDLCQVVDPGTKQRYQVRADPAAGDGTLAAASPERATRVGRKTIETFPPPLTTDASTVPSHLGTASEDGFSHTEREPAADTDPMQSPMPPPSTDARLPEFLSGLNPPLREPSIERVSSAFEPTKPSLEAPREPDFWLVGKREEAHSEASPITYREYAYAVEPGTKTTEAELLLRSRFREVQNTIRDCQPGKFVQLAVYDHVFRSQPVRPPIATLVWKDWQGEAVVRFPGSMPPPPPDGGSSRSGGSRPPSVLTAAVDSAATPLSEEMVRAWQEDLTPLARQSGARAGAQVILEALGRRIPCTAYLVESFDAKAAEFVVIAARGPHVDHVLGFRTPERQSPFPSLVQRGIPQAYDAASDFDYVRAERWRALGLRPTYGLCGLVRHGERLLGAIELADPVEEGAFSSEQARVVDFLCQRFAEYLRARPHDFE